MKKKMKIGMGQMLVQPGKPESNLERAGNMIRDAVRNKCDVIVLPECMDLGWTYPGAGKVAEPIPGHYSDILCEAAKKFDIHVVAGLTERCDELLYNTAVMISSKGDILTSHRKVNELDFAKNLYTTGNQLATVDTSFGRVGIPVCADLLPEGNPLGHSFGLMEARLLLSPSAWAVRPEHDHAVTPYGEEWQKSYTELAAKHEMTVIGVSNVGRMEGGEWDGWKCIGCSLAVGPDGAVLAQGSYGEEKEELIVFDLP
ncbi:MAG TPA: carbon-nitrogen hydrolase family protein [Bacillales bacterium]|nr:carbon-nitrogen hydrolase family protein [Bacillales bacterium]